jgi:predicted alpha/beta superfamily hydrolase
MPDLEPLLADAEVHVMRSQYVDDRFTVLIGHPGVRRDHDFREVLYLTDANARFGSAVDIVAGLVRARCVEPVLIVGIGYPAARVRQAAALRRRDLTPRTEPGDEPFVSFLRDELAPWVGRSYRTDAARTTYFGHSLGGLLGTWLLLTAPASFDRYLISSPALWWRERAVFEREQRRAGEEGDLLAEVYFGVGAEERAVPAAAYRPGAPLIDMVADLGDFVARLGERGYPGLRLSAVEFPDEIHETTPFVTLSRGLRALLPGAREAR